MSACVAGTICLAAGAATPWPLTSLLTAIAIGAALFVLAALLRQPRGDGCRVCDSAEARVHGLTDATACGSCPHLPAPPEENRHDPR